MDMMWRSVSALSRVLRVVVVLAVLIGCVGEIHSINGLRNADFENHLSSRESQNEKDTLNRIISKQSGGPNE